MTGSMEWHEVGEGSDEGLHGMAPKKGSSQFRGNFICCLLAMIFIVIGVLILFLTVLKATSPAITLTGVQVQSLYISDYSDLEHSRINITISVFVAVKNPNIATLNYTHRSNIELFYYGNQIASMYIPQGQIMSGETQHLSATIVVGPFSLLPRNSNPSDINPLEPDSSILVVPIGCKIHVQGRIKILNALAHRVQASIVCNIDINGHNGGSVYSFQCSRVG